jgi:hypothetical protein
MNEARCKTSLARFIFTGFYGYWLSQSTTSQSPTRRYCELHGQECGQLQQPWFDDELAFFYMQILFIDLTAFTVPPSAGLAVFGSLWPGIGSRGLLNCNRYRIWSVCKGVKVSILRRYSVIPLILALCLAACGPTEAEMQATTTQVAAGHRSRERVRAAIKYSLLAAEQTTAT